MPEPKHVAQHAKSQYLQGGSIVDGTSDLVMKGDNALAYQVPWILPVTVVADPVSVKVPRNAKLYQVTGHKGTVNGGAGDLVQVKDGSGNAVSNAIDLHVNANVSFKDTTIDPAYNVFAADSTVQVVPTVATDAGAQVELHFYSLPVA